jgi:hypothetical protein
LMRGFIDPPSPFASTKAWQDFLEQMKQLPQEDLDVQRERARAERELARRKKLGIRKT